MAAPAVPFYGKDVDRLARLSIAYKALMESETFLANWPVTVATPAVFKERINSYQSAYEAAINCDRRAIAARITAGEEAGRTWQKIVNYACSTEQDNSSLLEQMGALTKARKSTSTYPPRQLYAPDLVVVNVDQRGGVRASCSRERRRYTYDVQVTEGDPRVEEGWYHKASFGDCTKMDMDGFQSGKDYSFRCRMIGRDNSLGPWSLTVTIMVT
ncbi:hypothetical protein LPW11_20520 [Geomonas sp. RF6]|uniref:hypothetical protein n=1 Tax=Geomonas sp. RF6 TaxID=2897342 RepID=UPI001E49A3B4|nr:hypothetical protein [Geomonas sp. RF6]UFS70246.1 hypothetical protein LPW11_20520 [Geomonas sp. RF6]